jgi:hypothetical protein
MEPRREERVSRRWARSPSTSLLAAALVLSSPAAADEPAARAEHWAYRQLAEPPVPEVSAKAWVRTPVDAFILARLESAGIAPSRPAGRRTLLRRVTFDLTGLAPSPEDVEAFLEDDSPDAYEKVVDRLLASQRHGERWARHWMDLVHFAETHGHDQDRPRPHAWPYRDYLVASFNADKPYSRFAEEQVAGDVLYADDPEALVATGLLAAGPWDESSLRDIVAGTVDTLRGQYLDRDDMLTTVMATFVSTSVHCARCHDHKFDPIPQSEYYGLQAVFAGVDRANRFYDPDPEVHRARRALLAEKARLDRGIARAELLAPALQDEIAAWAASAAVDAVHWRVLDPTRADSQGGATVTEAADGSLLFAGERAGADTYTVEAACDLERLSAVRVEVLSDPSLPHGGPGRQDNGNLHLSELRVFAAPAGDPAMRRALPLHSASADFEQTGWTAAHAIDGDAKTAWGIYPEVGKTHHAVFEVDGEAAFAAGARLVFVLEQLHGGGHLIGRLRLAATDAAPPVRASALPERIRALLATPAASLSDDGRAELALAYLRCRLEERLAALPPPSRVYAAASDFEPDGNFKPAGAPKPVHVLARGEVERPGEAAAAGTIALVRELPSRFAVADPLDEGSRRAALARWISAHENPLTWRSIANRLWHHHFGRGLVETLNDFGRMGAKPSHPELLDWLACRVRDDSGSLKRAHRLLVTSAVYLQSSDERPECAAVDADDVLLWRMRRRRLEAECVRDAVLQATGRLDLAMGGPSAKQFVERPGIHVTPVVDYGSFDVDSPASLRRSTYRFVFRTVPDPFLATLDCPDASQLAPQRSESVTALQALAMLNNRFVVRQAEHFAARLAAERPDLEARIARAFQLALSRPPRAEELAVARDYATRHGLANFCRLVFNLSEFSYVD